MQAIRNNRWIGISASAVVILGGLFASSAHADVVRTGPNGASATTTRQVEDGTATRTTTGPNGESATTTTTVEEDTVTRTTTGPNGRSTSRSSTVTVEDGDIIRETTGSRGNTWEVQRSR
ncbi:MAG: hypothetical protein AAFY78_16025 [Cyanobacteria bacterium J06648_16]